MGIFLLTVSDAINPAIWPICKTTGWSLVVPLTRFETEIDLEIRKGYPALHNDKEFTKKQIYNAKKYLGQENVVDLPIRMTAEDFSYFSNALPSCFYRLGTGNKKRGIIHGLHTSKFDIDEKSLKIGMGIMAYLAINS